MGGDDALARLATCPLHRMPLSQSASSTSRSPDNISYCASEAEAHGEATSASLQMLERLYGALANDVIAELFKLRAEAVPVRPSHQ